MGIVEYGECKSNFHVNFRYNGRSKKPYYSYRCSGRLQHKNCTNLELRREYLEMFVLDVLKKRIFSTTLLDKLTIQLNNYTNNELEL